jgi:hypothetical protein
MNQFVFEGKLKTTLIAFMVLGAICLGLSWFAGDELHSRFWSNLLHNSVFFIGIAFLATFFLAVCVTAYAGWATIFKRVWEAFSAFLIPGFVLMIFIGLSVFLGWNHLYHWADPGSVATDEILQHKSGFLNKNWYLFGTLIIVGLWVFFARKFRSISLAEDQSGDASFAHHKSLRKYSAIFLPIAGFSSAAIIWQWVMSVDAHWYSTLFAWYATASWFVAMICLTIMVLLYLKSKGYYESVTAEHLHDLGKFLFGFSIFWTYLWFSQFMLIWYANVGETTGYFKLRRDEYPVLFYGNLVLNFILPFFVLMRNDTKRKVGSLGIIAGLVFIGHWWDYFLMIKPGVLHTAHEVGGHGHGHGEAAHGAAEHVGHAVEHGAAHASHFVSGFTLPGLLEIGTMLGFLGLFLFVAFTALSKASLVPKNDPYLEESLHHHT